MFDFTIPPINLYNIGKKQDMVYFAGQPIKYWLDLERESRLRQELPSQDWCKEYVKVLGELEAYKIQVEQFKKAIEEIKKVYG